MKRCPQCNNVYEDDVQFCLNDGAGLVKQTFALPSDADEFEAETVIRHDPIIVDLSPEEVPTEAVVYRNPPVETVIIEKPAQRTKSDDVSRFRFDSRRRFGFGDIAFGAKFLSK